MTETPKFRKAKKPKKQDHWGGKIKHGHSPDGKKSPTYHSWQSMLTRCNKTYHRAYKNYGGRGIKVCDEWNCFENFLRDMGERPQGKSLDRIDNNKGYSKENCRWASRVLQNINTRKRIDAITSKHKGVCFVTKTGLWLAQLRMKWSQSFKTEKEAAIAYQKKLQQYLKVLEEEIEERCK